jgi:hypothetical protein
MHACCQSPIAHRSSPCPLSRLSAVAHHHIIVTPSPKPNRTRPPRILSGSLSPRDMHACGGLVGAALYDRTGKSDQSVNSTTRAALLAPRNISRKIRVRQATRDETRKTYRATAAAGLGAAGDGSAAFRACSVGHGC